MFRLQQARPRKGRRQARHRRQLAQAQRLKVFRRLHLHERADAVALNPALPARLRHLRRVHLLQSKEADPVNGLNRASRALQAPPKVRRLRLNQERHLKGGEAGADPEQLRKESPRHQKQLLRLRRRWLPSAEEAKAVQRQADRHNI
jgi:hypothetical protein